MILSHEDDPRQRRRWAHNDMIFARYSMPRHLGLTAVILVFFATILKPTVYAVYTESLSLQSLEWHRIDATNIPSSVRYILFEAHSQRYPVTVAYDDFSTKPFIRDQYYTDHDVGLVRVMKDQNDLHSAYIWIGNPQNLTINVLVIVTPHGLTEPIPGGCNMEFPVQISPFLRLMADRTKVRLEFQHALMADPVPSPRSLMPRRRASCDASFYLLSYDIYVYYLAENDYTEAELFRGLTLMTNISTIKQHGIKIKPFEAGPRTRAVFMAYPGRGAIYNVITKFEEQEAAYVPIATYGCDFFSNVDGCGRLHSLVGKIFVATLGALGLIVCLRGHQYFQLQMAFFGFLGAAIPTFIVITKYTALTPEERDIVMFCCGIAGAFLWVAFWRIFALPIISIMLGGFVLGFLVVSTILFSSIGNYEMFRNDVNYWLVIGCGVLIVPILLMPFGVFMSIFSSSIVGSYTAIVAVDRFVGGSLAYIVLNVFKRAIFEDIYMATNQVPFQAKDIILSISWGVLAFIGLGLQIFASQGEPHFSPPTPCFYERRTPRRSRRRVRRIARNGTTRADPEDGCRISQVHQRLGVGNFTRASVRPTTPPVEYPDETSPLFYHPPPPPTAPTDDPALLGAIPPIPPPPYNPYPTYHEDANIVIHDDSHPQYPRSNHTTYQAI